MRAERAVVRGTYEAHRRGSRRVAQDERTQARIRVAVDRAQRANAARDARNAQRAARLNAQALRRDEALRTRPRRLDELSDRIGERINAAAPHPRDVAGP